MKKPIFDKYAVAVAKAFHLEIDKLFEKSKRKKSCRCETDTIFIVYGKTN